MNTKALPTIRELTANEMIALANRLDARARSPLLRDQPEQQADNLLAARIIRIAAGETSIRPSVPIAPGVRL